MSCRVVTPLQVRDHQSGEPQAGPAALALALAAARIHSALPGDLCSGPAVLCLVPVRRTRVGVVVVLQRLQLHPQGVLPAQVWKGGGFGEEEGGVDMHGVWLPGAAAGGCLRGVWPGSVAG